MVYDRYIREILNLMIIDTNNIPLMRAQLHALSRQIPLLYLVFCVNVVFSSYIFFNYAPFWLTVTAPGLFVIGCIACVAVVNRVEIRDINAAGAERQLFATLIFSALVGIAFIDWAMALYSYGDPVLRGYMAFTVAVTINLSVFCLLHLPAAALLLGAITGLPFTAVLLMSREQTFVVIGVMLLLVGLGVTFMIFVSAFDFSKMVGAQTRAERLSEINSELANVDSLTELPNRRQFFARLEQILQQAGAEGRVVVGVMDLDGFKPVNDLYGHLIGDRVLVECGARIGVFADDRVFLARIGGDEFGIIFDRPSDISEALDLGARLCAELKQPFQYDGVAATISASVGFAAYPEAGVKAEKLYEHADYALYFAKQNCRGELVLFSTEHESKMRELAIVEQCLRKADLETEMSLHFQPLYKVGDRAIVAFEALARWTSPEIGSVPPDKFIRVAERSEVIFAITRAMLRKALHAAEHWPAHVGLSFNLSIRDLMSPTAVMQIIAIIEASNVDPARIDLEVTETALMSDFDRAKESIDAFKRIGVKISLDDFGTGYSSLSYMHRLPLDKIKIDRSFVQEMGGSVTARDIIKSMIALCRNLDLNCVIEGVETSEQFDLLKSFGCNTVQGFLFSKPIPQIEVAEFIRVEADRVWRAQAHQRLA